MGALIALVVIGIFFGIGVFILMVEMGDSSKISSLEDDCPNYKNNDDLPPYHYTVGGYAAGGITSNNASNNYGLSSRD